MDDRSQNQPPKPNDSNESESLPRPDTPNESSDSTQVKKPEDTSINNAKPSSDMSESENKEATEAEPEQPKPMGEYDMPAQPAPSVQGDTSIPPVPVKKSRRNLWMIIAAAILVVLGVGAWLVYALWYQNPEKVVTDGIVNALKAKTAKLDGTLTAEMDGNTTMKAEFKAGSTNAAGIMDVKLTFASGDQETLIDGSGIFSEGNLYVKVRNAKEVITGQLGEIPTELQPTVDDFVAKINDRWIKISANDLKSVSGAGETEASQQKCLDETTKKIQSDGTLSGDIAKAYQGNRFIQVVEELGDQNGSMGYALKADTEKAKSFVNAIKETESFKMLHDCDPSIELNADDLTQNAGSETTTDVSVWVSRWTHQITKVDVLSEDPEQKEKLTASVVTMFNEPVSIDVPADADTLSVDELMKEFQNLYSAAFYYSFAGSTEGYEAALGTEL